MSILHTVGDNPNNEEAYGTIMVSLKTDIGSIALENPSMIASGIMDETGKSLVRVLESGAGAVVTKSVGLEPNAGAEIRTCK